MRRRSNLRVKRSAELVDPNVKRAFGVFTFWNGDRYEGEYKLQPERLLLVKEGRGVYITNDFNKYECGWTDDHITDDEVIIRHNNGAMFKGGITDGEMCGGGVYTFPDGASIEAIWFKNKPLANIYFREPRGFAWIAESLTQNEVRFSPENYFWREACEAEFTGSTTATSGSQEDLN